MKRKNINSKEGVIGYKRGFDSVAIIVYWVMAFVTSISVCIMNFKIIFVARCIGHKNEISIKKKP